MSSVAARAAISLPIALFCCPYSLHCFVLRLHSVFVKRSLLNRLQSETAVVSYPCPLWHLLPRNFCMKPFNLLCLDKSQGRNLKYLFHRCYCFMPRRSPRTGMWSQSCWYGQLRVYNTNQQYHFVSPWFCVQSSKTSIYGQQLQKKAAAI